MKRTFSSTEGSEYRSPFKGNIEMCTYIYDQYICNIVVGKKFTRFYEFFTQLYVSHDGSDRYEEYV